MHGDRGLTDSVWVSQQPHKVSGLVCSTHRTGFREVIDLARFPQCKSLDLNWLKLVSETGEVSPRGSGRWSEFAPGNQERELPKSSSHSLKWMRFRGFLPTVWGRLVGEGQGSQQGQPRVSGYAPATECVCQRGSENPQPPGPGWLEGRCLLVLAQPPALAGGERASGPGFGRVPYSPPLPPHPNTGVHILQGHLDVFTLD